MTASQAHPGLWEYASGWLLEHREFLANPAPGLGQLRLMEAALVASVARSHGRPQLAAVLVPPARALLADATGAASRPQLVLRAELRVPPDVAQAAWLGANWWRGSTGIEVAERIWAAHRLLAVDHRQRLVKALELISSHLSAQTDPAAIFQATHLVFYATDFGRSPDMVAAVPTAVADHLVRTLAAQPAGIDLVAELACCLGILDPSRVPHLTTDRLLAGLAAATEGRRPPGSDPFAGRFHDFVAASLAGAILGPSAQETDPASNPTPAPSRITVASRVPADGDRARAPG